MYETLVEKQGYALRLSKTIAGDMSGVYSPEGDYIIYLSGVTNIEGNEGILEQLRGVGKDDGVTDGELLERIRSGSRGSDAMIYIPAEIAERPNFYSTLMKTRITKYIDPNPVPTCGL